MIKILRREMPLVVFCEISEKEWDKDHDYLLQYVSSQKRERILKYHRVIDKKCGLFSEIIVRYICCEFLNCSNRNLSFSYNKFGKPFINDYPLHFNISHSDNFIMCSFDYKNIGADVEKIQDISCDLANRFFTANEISYINQNELFDIIKFYEIWTKKEAYIKWEGKGLSIPLNSFDVLQGSDEYYIYTNYINNFAYSICSSDEYHKFNLLKVKEDEINKIWRTKGGIDDE